MWLSRYFVLFSIFSCMGWIYETTYVTVKKGKWDNRGFLFGPVCPIYGVGGVGIGMIYDWLQNSSHADEITWWQVFLIAYIGSVILEYVTHWFLEWRFHAYWWDYSKVPMNIHGRVCVPASIGFGCAGILIYYVLYPAVADAVNPIPGIILELLALLCMGFLAADTALTVAALTNILRSLEEMEESIDCQMDHLVSSLEDKKAGVGQRIESSKEMLAREKLTKEHMERYMDHMTGIRRGTLSRISGFATHAGRLSPFSQKNLKQIWVLVNSKNPILKVKGMAQKQEKKEENES